MKIRCRVHFYLYDGVWHARMNQYKIPVLMALDNSTLHIAFEITSTDFRFESITFTKNGFE